MDNPKDLDAKGGGYQQCSVLLRTGEIRGEEELFDAFFSCGDWCYEGNLYVASAQFTLENLPSVVSLLQRQQSSLQCMGSRASLSTDSTFVGPLRFLEDTQEFVAAHLTTEHVQHELCKWSKVFSWIDDDERNTYFEIQVAPPECMQNVACMASKAYIRDLLYVSLYFEGVVYLVIKSAEGEQALLDVYFPPVVQHGQGLHISTFNDASMPWKRLTLWHNVGEDARNLLEAIPEAKFISIPSASYLQTYVIMRNSIEAPASAAATAAQRDVLFRFGSWCYSGTIELAPVLNLADIQHVIPALRMQQSQLGFYCDVRHIPEKSRFAAPLAFLTEVTPVLEQQLLQSERILHRMMQEDGHKGTEDRHLMSWLDGDSSKTFYEFQMNDDLAEMSNVELVASKCYHPSGVIFITIAFGRCLYVILCDGSLEQPLLDSSFPDISTKGRGYQLAAYSDGVVGFRALRKVSIWQAWLEDGAIPPAIAQARVPPQSDPRQRAVNESMDGDEVEAVPKQGLRQIEPDCKAEDRQRSPSSSPAKKNTMHDPVSKSSPHPVARPHHVRQQDVSLQSRLAEIRAKLGDDGSAAPWDKHGSPLKRKL